MTAPTPSGAWILAEFRRARERNSTLADCSRPVVCLERVTPRVVTRFGAR